MLLAALAVIAGLLLLTFAADRFVSSASIVARTLGMSPLLIGMLIIGFGTSTPEIFVSVNAAWQDNPGLALGNAYGSNIINVAVILGLTALLAPIAVQSAVVRREIPLLLAATALTLALVYHDGHLGRNDGVMLLVMFLFVMGWSIRQGMNSRDDQLAREVELEVGAPREGCQLAVQIIWLLVGLVLLILSSRILVWGAVHIAQALGLSDLVIGLTIVAIGTSLPELASSLVAVRKGEHDLVLGNIIGSNLFNTLIVAGLTVVISPVMASAELLRRDLPVMVALTLALLLVALSCSGRPRRIGRLEGGVLLFGYVAYLAWILVSLG